MSSLQTPNLSSSSSQKRFNNYASINLPKFQRVQISPPKKLKSSTKLVHAFNGSIQTIVPSQKDEIATSQMFHLHSYNPSKSKVIIQLHEILVAVYDKLKMHKTIMVRLNTAILMLIAAKGMLLIKNKIQTSKSNATTYFKKLQTDKVDVNSTMKTSKFEPKTNGDYQTKVLKSHRITNNGWSPELEKEMREILEVVKRKEMEDYERRENLALKITKTLAILGPLLTGIAAIGSALEKHGLSWAGIMAAMAKSLADLIKPLEGMVLEICKNCGDFLQDTLEATLEEKDCEKRENGELFEMKVARKLGRSVSQLRQLALKFAAYDSAGIHMDEFSSNLF